LGRFDAGEPPDSARLLIAELRNVIDRSGTLGLLTELRELMRKTGKRIVANKMNLVMNQQGWPLASFWTFCHTSGTSEYVCLRCVIFEGGWAAPQPKTKEKKG
jgi:hypothetical protein